MGFSHQNLPRDERGAMSALKRTDGSPVTRSRRLALRECGIAYRPRGPRRRSRRSSRSARESHTGRRAVGDVRLPAARYARCGAPTLSEVSTAAAVYITGKRCDAKVSRTVWREADGKGLHPEHLAGGPPYPVPSRYLVNPSDWRPDERGRLCEQQQRRCDCPRDRQKRTSAI